jgi:hypothetical protein
MFLDDLQGLQTILIRHPDIEEDHVRMFFARHFEALDSIGGHIHLGPIPGKNRRQQLSDGRIIIDY